MPDAIVRKMTHDDLNDVINIEAASFHTPWTRDAFAREIDENACARYLVVDVEGRAVAFAGLWMVLDEAHVTNIAVHPRYRGKGYGEKITRALIQTAVDNGAETMTLEVREKNDVAQRLYRKLGFVDVGFRRGYYEDTKEDAVLMTLFSLPDNRPSILAAFFEKFLLVTGRPLDTKYVESFHFDITESSANELLALTQRGIKRATASSMLAYTKTGDPVPKPGDLSIVTDFHGYPHCVIETRAITVKPFRDISWEMAMREGEDTSLNSWRRNHEKFFMEEGKALGYAFTWDMEVVFEDFVVVYQGNR